MSIGKTTQQPVQPLNIGLNAAASGAVAYACCAVLTSINPAAAFVYTATNVAVSQVVTPIFKEKLKDVPATRNNILLGLAVSFGTPIAAGLCATNALGYSFSAKAIVGTFLAVKVGTLLAGVALAATVFAAFVVATSYASPVNAN